jgi:hypothetical protein
MRGLVSRARGDRPAWGRNSDIALRTTTFPSESPTSPPPPPPRHCLAPLGPCRAASSAGSTNDGASRGRRGGVDRRVQLDQRAAVVWAWWWCVGR